MNFHISSDYKLFTNKKELIDSSFYYQPVLTKGIFDFVIARAGWGIVWNCLLESIPILLFPPCEFDDPEVINNYKTLLELKLALPISILELKDFKRELTELNISIKSYKKELKSTFGTLSGSDFIAKHGMISKFIL